MPLRCGSLIFEVDALQQLGKSGVDLQHIILEDVPSDSSARIGLAAVRRAADRMVQLPISSQRQICNAPSRLVLSAMSCHHRWVSKASAEPLRIRSQPLMPSTVRLLQVSFHSEIDYQREGKETSLCERRTLTARLDK